MKKPKLIMVGCVAVLVSGTGHAEWKGEAELGVSSSTGNTEATVANGRINADREALRWLHNLFAEAYYAEDTGTRTAERYALGYRPRYFLTDKDYAFGILRYDQDQFSAIDNRFSEVLGYGRQLLDNETHKLEAEIGVGARQTEYVASPDTADLAENEALGFLGAKYEGRLSEHSKLSEALRIEFGEENTFIESVTGLTMTIVGNLSSKITYTVRYNSDIVGARGEYTDTLTGVNLLYSF